MNTMIKRTIATAIFVVLGVVVNAQTTSYDKALADSLGADAYGMKTYVMAILQEGTTKVTDKAKRDSLFRGHMQNIGRLASAGKLVVAGPMGENDKHYTGIFILNVSTIEEAKALLDTDPVLKAKVMDAELYKWYGSAALPMYLSFHKKVEQKSH